MSDDGTRYIGAHDPREAARLAAQAHGGLPELRAALALHEPPIHARVLEVGCGGGDFTRSLLEALPDTTITATDYDARLLESARHALADTIQSGRVTLRLADAANLPFPARAFDLVACRCVLMHQPDPFGVVAEMYRVLETGGVALAIEPDWGARALYPDSEALDSLLDVGRRARRYGFPDIFLGRKLYALFGAAGFAGVCVQPTAFSETAAQMPATAEEAMALPGPEGLLEQARGLLRREHLISEADLDDLIARLRTVRHHPDYFSAGMDFAVSGRKPEPRWPDAPL